MKKGQVYQGIVERVDFPNKGVVYVEDEICIVKNSLPGQKILFSVNKVRKGKAEGRLLEVIEPSPLETGSPCSLFGLCGGCTYLSLEYDEQLKIKEQQVRKLLDSVLTGQKESYRWEGIKASPREYEYRNKMEFTFGDEVKDGPLSLGMHKRGSFHDIVTVSDCKLVDADYRLILNATLHFMRECGFPYYHRMKKTGLLRHLLVRKALKTGDILIALVTTTQYSGEGMKNPGKEKFVSVLKSYCEKILDLPLTGTVQGILHMENDSVADVIQSDRTEVIYGRDYFFEELLGLRFKISPFSFFQTNTSGAEVLYRTVREYAGNLKENGKGNVIFDLYSGTGTIAQLMAPVAEKVIGVEIVEEAVLAARKNAAMNGLENCEFIAGDVLEVLDTIGEKPDFIILDPPRDGIHPKALPKIIHYGVEKLVYVSCKPTSLIRDIEVFLRSGYQVERAVAVDQFPWTANVETVCLLTRKNKNFYKR